MNGNATTLVTLRTGREVPAAALQTTMLALRRLAETNPIAVYELRAAAADRAHDWWPGTGEAALALGLVTRGQDRPIVHEVVRDIVLAAVSEDGMTFLSAV